MTREQYLLTLIGEECNEVAQRCSKAIRFGIDEIQPGQTLTNGERIQQEIVDLVAVVKLCVEEKIIPDVTPEDGDRGVAEKLLKIEKFYRFSKSRGVIDGFARDQCYPHPEANPS